MGESRWPIVVTGTVAAETEAVVAWWFHPARSAEFLSRAEARGALDLTVTRSREDGVFVTIIRYRTAQGWEFDHRLEVDLDADRMPPRHGDRYVARSRDVETARRRAQHFTVRCTAIQEFVAVRSDETRITAEHEHTMTGGRWLWRWKRRRRDFDLHNGLMRTRTEQCERALGPADGASATI